LANPDIGVTQIAHRLGVSPATPIGTSPPREPRTPVECDRLIRDTGGRRVAKQAHADSQDS
jgi:hypothetical protein